MKLQNLFNKIVWKKKILRPEMEEFEIKIKNQYKKISDVEIDKGIRAAQDEIEVIIDRKDKAMIDLNERHRKEIETIREQVRVEYRPKIEERNNEIIRLNKIIFDHKDFYNSIKRREYELYETLKTANSDFERAMQKFNEGSQAIKRVGDGVEKYNRKQTLIDNQTKNKKLLEET